MVQERQRLTPENLGDGIIRPMEWRKFSSERGTVVPVYSDNDQGIVIWNLEPGQENECHLHPANAHCFLVLEGNGHYLQGNPAAPDYKLVPVQAQDIVLIPRQTLHGMRNTGSVNLSYMAVTTNQEGIGYLRILLEDVVAAGGPPIAHDSELAQTKGRPSFSS